MLIGGSCTPRRTDGPRNELFALAPDVTAGQLANGLRYFIIPDDDVSLMWAISVGRMHEEDGEGGAASAMATAFRAEAQSADPNEPEPDVFVMDDTTKISIGGFRDLDVELARMRSSLDAQLRMDDVAPSFRDQVPVGNGEGGFRARHSGTRLGRHVSRADLAALHRFRKRWYVPSRMTLVVEGPWKHSDVAAAIEERFGELPDRESPPDPPLLAGKREIVTESGCCYVLFSFVVESPAPRSRADMRAVFVRKLFERALHNRLRNATKTHQDGPIGPSVMTARWRLTKRYVSFEIEFVTNSDKAQATAVIARELERVRLYGFEQEELQLARQEDPPPPRDISDHRLPRGGSCSYGWYVFSSCCDLVMRAIQGFPPLTCHAETALYGELLPTLRDDDVNALRATIDPRLAAIAALDDKDPTTIHEIRTALQSALSGVARSRSATD